MNTELPGNRLKSRNVYPARLILLLLLASSAKAEVAAETMRPLIRDVEAGLQKQVDKAFDSPLWKRAQEIINDLLHGATVSEAVAKQVHSAAEALIIQKAFLPVIDSSLRVESRIALKSEFTGPVERLVSQNAAKGVAEYCERNERDCACLAGSELSRKIAADLLDQMKKRPLSWAIMVTTAGSEAILAKLIVRLSVFLASEMVDGTVYMVRNGPPQSSFCASLQSGSARQGPAQIDQALNLSLGLVN